MTRNEHMKWCKERALAELKAGNIKGAVASMILDLSKHPETESSVRLGRMLAATVTDEKSARKFIEGFH